MQPYEKELNGIVRAWLDLHLRIVDWQKSLPPDLQSSTPIMDFAKQFRLTVKRPELFIENLDLINNRYGGLEKFLKNDEPERDLHKNKRCKNCEADISELHHWAKYCKECSP